MARWKNWQRGTADLVSVAMGLVIMAVVTAGTTASMVYGREALIREEHYKAAAYLLRGYMEAQQAALQIKEGQLDLQADDRVTVKALDASTDRNGVQVVYCTISRDQIVATDLPETGTGIDYYTITMRAGWTERDLAGGGRQTRMLREITLKTSTVIRQQI